MGQVQSRDDLKGNTQATLASQWENEKAEVLCSRQGPSCVGTEVILETRLVLEQREKACGAQI